MHSFTINGLDMDRWTVLHGSTYQTDITMRRSSVVVNGMHGHIPAGTSKTDTPAFTFQLFPGIDTTRRSSAFLDTLTDDLRALLAMPTLKMRRNRSGMLSEATVALVGHNWDPDAFMCGEQTRVAVTVEIPGVFWRGLDWVTKTIPAGTSVIFDDSTGAVTDATVQFAGSAPDPMLTDLATGTGIGFIGTPGGTAAFVNAGDADAWSGTVSDWAPTATPLRGAVDYPGAGLLELTPTIGTAADFETDAPTPLGDLTWAEAAMTWGEADGPWDEPSVQHTSLLRGFRIHSTHAATIRYRRAYL